MFDVRLFGTTEVRTPRATMSSRDFGGVKQRHILQLLALNGAMSKAELAELLWGGTPAGRIRPHSRKLRLAAAAADRPGLAGPPVGGRHPYRRIHARHRP